MSRVPRSARQLLVDLKPFADKARRGGGVGRSMFSLCAKAAFANSYDFALYSHSRRVNGVGFFAAGTLRGICEGLIVLGAVRSFPHRDRDALLRASMNLEVLLSLRHQQAFFKNARPYQQVLEPPSDADEQIASCEGAMRDVWKRHGWTLTKGTMPQVRQLAERQGQPVLAALYEFMYRFTSGMVHFNPGVLLRSGWGPTPHSSSFSPKNFDGYYVAFARIYSVYLLCLHFELLRRQLRPTRTTSAIVDALKAVLRAELRWPEMITFEEMNIAPPRLNILRLLGIVTEAAQSRGKRFLR